MSKIDGNGVWYDRQMNIRYSSAFVDLVVSLFRRGTTTLQIAKALNKPEYIIYNALAKREQKDVS